MKVLWICGLPREIQLAFPDIQASSQPHDASWILGHLPPPPDIELHLACPVTRGPWSNEPRLFRNTHVHIVRCLRGRLQTGYMLDIIPLWRLYCRINPDIIHGWGTEACYANVARILSRRSVAQVQGLMNANLRYRRKTLWNRLVAWREGRLLRRAKTIIVESEFSERFARHYCQSRAKVIRVDHPLRPNFLNAAPSQREYQQALYLGRLSTAKGYLDAVHAFAVAAPLPWRLLLIGDGLAADRERLQAEISARNLQDRVRHIPCADADEVVRHMQESSIFLLPTYMDTGPTSLKEALAMGLWPVCYDNSGPQCFIRLYGVGTLTKTGSVKQLATELHRVIDECPWHDFDLPAVIQKVRADFSKDIIWRDLRSVYQTVLDETW